MIACDGLLLRTVTDTCCSYKGGGLGLNLMHLPLSVLPFAWNLAHGMTQSPAAMIQAQRLYVSLYKWLTVKLTDMDSFVELGIAGGTNP